MVYYLWGVSNVSQLVVVVNYVAIHATWQRPETLEMDVFTLQLITMSEAASLDVWGGEMPAKCSHHDLMRWFRCSRVLLAILCNSNTATPQFLRPACVTSAFVHIRHVAHNPAKHVEWLLRRPGSNGPSINVGCVVWKLGERGEYGVVTEKREL